MQKIKERGGEERREEQTKIERRRAEAGVGEERRGKIRE